MRPTPYALQTMTVHTSRGAPTGADAATDASAATGRDAASPGQVSGAEADRTSGSCCYALRGVTKRHRLGWGRRARTVLANADITLTVQVGEIFGLLGPNGAGKSTLVRQLAGLDRPDAGGISLFGHELGGRRPVVGHLVAYLAQDEPALDELTVGIAVETTARLRGLGGGAAAAAAGIIAELGLAELADRPLKRLSGGQRRLACVAAALVGDRPVLLLDEPTTGMDPVARRAVWQAVERRRQERGTTVVLVTHNVLEAESVLDRVAVIDDGRVIACDTPGGLKARVDGGVRLDLVWRRTPPLDDPVVGALHESAAVTGRRWTVRLPADEARAALAAVMAGPALPALDDFTLATPTLEDVYLALGGRGGLVKD